MNVGEGSIGIGAYHILCLAAHTRDIVYKIGIHNHTVCDCQNFKISHIYGFDHYKSINNKMLSKSLICLKFSI